MKVRILITLKNGVLDTQGKAIENSLTKDLGFTNVSEVRQGRLVELEIAEKNTDNIQNIVADLCDKVLVNQVIEDYSYEII